PLIGLLRRFDIISKVVPRSARKPVTGGFLVIVRTGWRISSAAGHAFSTSCVCVSASEGPERSGVRSCVIDPGEIHVAGLVVGRRLPVSRTAELAKAASLVGRSLSVFQRDTCPGTNFHRNSVPGAYRLHIPRAGESGA